MTVALTDFKSVHFIGIGGIGMSALARYLLSRGYQVSGSDQSPGQQGADLRALGASVTSGHAASNIGSPDLVVISSAVPDDNPERVEAQQRGIPVVKRAELLGAVMNAGRGIAVAGTHGKTTTSAMIGHFLVEAGLDPTVLIGGMSANLGSNARLGSSDLVLVEADEYDGSFWQLQPSIGVINSVEPDHLDFYLTEERFHDSFRRFAGNVRDLLVICADDDALPPLLSGLPTPITTFGTLRGEWRAVDIDDRDGVTSFRVPRAGEHPFTLQLGGLYNVRNALAAIAVGDALNIPMTTITEALAGFRGVQRRFEVKGEAAGVLVMDDYAHHPTEIRSALAAIKGRYQRPVRLIFQPHTYSRTKAFAGDFANAFGDADTLYLMDIYAARERDTLGISGQDLAQATSRRHAHVRYTPTDQDALAAVLQDAGAGDVVVTMGAGDVYELGPALLAALDRT